MKCPFCNSDMTNGYLVGGRSIFWTPNSSKMLLITNKKIGEMKLKGILDTSGITAYKCDNCKKIIVDYSDK